MSHDAAIRCTCVAEHRPPVLEYDQHHIVPLALGGPDEAANRVWVCPTTHANIHEALRLMIRAGRSLSDHELQHIEDRPMSRYAGAMAREGFRRIADTP